MRKILPIAIIGILVVAVGAFLLMRDDADSQTANTNQTASSNANSVAGGESSDQNANADNEEDNASTVKTIADLLTSGSSVRCDFSTNDTNGAQAWTIYVDDQKFRGDYSVDTDDDTAWDGHMIRNEEYMYNWGTNDSQTFGTKIKLSALESLSNTNSVPTNTNTSAADLDYDQSFEMDCDRWNADDSKFAPPSDVTFTDLTAQLEQFSGVSDQLKTTQCAACDVSSDATVRDQCRAALGCE